MVFSVLRKIKNFFTDKTGGVALGFALTLPPLITYSVVAITTTDTLARTTRLNQAVQTAAVVLAQTDASAADAPSSRSIVEVWTNANMLPVKQYDPSELSFGSVPDAPPTDDIIEINLSYTPTYTTKIPGFLKFENLYFGSQESVTVERVWTPMELVFITDSSASAGMASNIQHMSRVVEGIIDEVFRGKDSSTDAHISLVSFSNHASIEIEAARKLLTDESRMLSPVGFNNKTQSTYDSQVEIFLQAGKAYLLSDLLQDGGPGVDMNVACVKRPARDTFGSISEYPDIVEDPDHPLDLLVIDGRGGDYYNGSYKYAYDLIPSIEYGGWGYYTNANPYAINNDYDTTYDVHEMAVIPESWNTGPDSERYSKSKWLYWVNPATNKTVKSSSSHLVSIPGGCALMPNLIGSQSKDELMERIAKIGGNVSTGGDEGIAWAMRALSPNYREIWDVSDNYPADYHSGVDKVIVFFTSYLNEGYVGDGWGFGEDGLTEMYKRLHENGVRVVAFIDSKDGSLSNVGYRQHDYINQMDGSYLIGVNSDYSDVPDQLDQYIERTYQVKIIATSNI